MKYLRINGMIFFEKLWQISFFEKTIGGSINMENNEKIKEEIKQLKKERNALILAHFYQDIEVQAVADFIGDSFELAKKAKEAEEDVIVFCGVHFMAEGAKILNPTKTVLLPVMDAGCPMADMATSEDVIALKEKHPDAAVVTYVNSTADVKCVSDICCTSSSIMKVVDSLEQKKIIFVPDRNLGQYIAEQIKDKEVILFDGHCPVHSRITVEDVNRAKKAQPDALLLVHPECVPEVLNQADFVGSTSQIIRHALESDNKDIMIGTEVGVVDYLKKKAPEKNFYLLSPKMVCKNMKKTSLIDVRNALKNNEHEIIMDSQIIQKAFKSLDRMMKA